VSTLVCSNTGILNMNEIVVVRSRLLWLRFSYLFNQCIVPQSSKQTLCIIIMTGERTRLLTFAEDQLSSAALLTSYLILILCKSTLADTLSEAA